MSTQETNKTPISEFGKFRLIDHLTKDAAPRNRSTIVGIGDDASVIDNEQFKTLVSTDLLLEGIHFNLIYSPLKHLGYKAVIRAVSDIFAMNGKPEQILISLGISSRFSVEQVEEIYEGIYLACEKYGVDLAGGDTTSSLTGLTIGVTAVGKAERESIVRRNGARANDLICVTGDFGAAFMGLQLLERERKIFENSSGAQPELIGFEYIIGRQLKPELPVQVLDQLTEADIIPTSMTDVSEGLASDLLQICKSSSTGCRIFRDKIPVDNETVRMAEEFGLDPVIPALNGGEDCELLFTINLDDYDKIVRVSSVSVIGHMSQKEDGRYLVTGDGQEIELTAQGWKK